ncbi:sensor histidine kinase KdpD [Streptomyces sp. WAC 06783]|uniref:sensor histidine kinase n=1 Tax=Streptomyces sp. WAC 06783 TaxID=2203211 RepID=UPI0021AE2C18|nr:ATP-binding protein [Streptomyces sp. WAC 06783]
MVREGSSPEGPRPTSVLAWILPAAATAVAAAVATATVPSQASTPVIWIGAVATVAVALVTGEVSRRGRALAALRERAATQQAALGRQEAETVRLAEELLPEVVARLSHGEFPEDVYAAMTERITRHAREAGLTPEFTAAHQAVLRSVLDAVVGEEDLRESAQRAFVNIARRVQAIVHQQAQELRDMEDRHGQSPDVFGDLLRLDHGTALIGRLADSIAVLGGARPGRQWSRAVPLFSVLRGAMSRIIDYQRVELHSVSEVAVVGTAVEPLIHALAELLDNATRYSPPQTRVHLTAVEVQSGIAVEIEDGGVSMSEEARKRAERMLQQAQQGIDVNDLGETPRLGLAVVGRLAQAYNFQVSLRPSAYGGVRAVLIVPQDLITTAAATGRAHGIGASSGPRTARTERREVSAAPQATGPRHAAPAPSVPAAQARNGFPTQSQNGFHAQAQNGIPAQAQNGFSAQAQAQNGFPPQAQAQPPASAPFAPSMPPAAAAVPQQFRDDVREETQDDLPVVTERTANGLPQRRRKSRATAPVPPAAPGAHAAPAASPPAVPSTGGTESAAPVQPGMWLAAFQSGLSGESHSGQSGQSGQSGRADASGQANASGQAGQPERFGHTDTSGRPGHLRPDPPAEQSGPVTDRTGNPAPTAGTGTSVSAASAASEKSDESSEKSE